jgi:hypothetical protein
MTRILIGLLLATTLLAPGAAPADDLLDQYRPQAVVLMPRRIVPIL